MEVQRHIEEAGAGIMELKSINKDSQLTFPSRSDGFVCLDVLFMQENVFF